MITLPVILEILNQTPDTANIVADMLFDISTKEALVYEKKLRQPVFFYQNIIDVAMKFGDKRTREVVGRFMRHHPKKSITNRASKKAKKKHRKQPQEYVGEAMFLKIHIEQSIK